MRWTRSEFRSCRSLRRNLERGLSGPKCLSPIWRFSSAVGRNRFAEAPNTRTSIVPLTMKTMSRVLSSQRIGGWWYPTQAAEKRRNDGAHSFMVVEGWPPANLPTTRMSELTAWLPDQWKQLQAARMADLRNPLPPLRRYAVHVTLTTCRRKRFSLHAKSPSHSSRQSGIPLGRKVGFPDKWNQIYGHCSCGTRLAHVTAA